MKEEFGAILLTRGKWAIVDIEDFEELSRYRWGLTGLGHYWYACRKNSKKNIRMHRQIMSAPRGTIVDHINGDTFDNRKKNLRICSIGENCRNTISRRGRSKYKGVSWNEPGKNWRARIRVSDVPRSLGCYKTEEEAALAYNAAAKLHFGEFARVNRIESDI